MAFGLHPHFLSLCPLSPPSTASPPPTTPPEKRPGRHHLRSPDLPRRHRHACRRNWPCFHRFFANLVLSSGHQFRHLSACGGTWVIVAVGHWIPVQSPSCHERVGSCRIQRIVSQTPGYSEIANPRCRRHQRHQWRSLLGLGVVTGSLAPPTPHRQTLQLKMAKVTRVTNSRINIGYDELHRAAPTAKLHSSLVHDIGHVVQTHCLMQWKSWKVMPAEIQKEVRGQLSKNYNLEDLDDESLAYGCPKELEGQEDSWAWLCTHFQAPDYVNKAKVNKGNRNKKTLLHHSRDIFGDIYVRPGNELAESLHTTMVEMSQLVLQESASQLLPDTPIESVDPPQDAGFQILTETLDQTLGRRSGTYCRGMGNARQRERKPRSSLQSNSQVTTLIAKVAELQGQMSMLLESLERSGFLVQHFGPSSTSEPFHPEHAHQTSTPMDPQTSEPHMPNDQVDFGTLFD
ncbi:unnamed protein product [Prunus armeniaca]